MAITSDWHIHSRNSCDDACITVQDLIERAAEKGITDFGLTDHLHSSYNLPDIAASRREYLACSPSPHFHFGVEVSCVSRWELDEIATGKYDSPTYGLRHGGPAGGELAIGLTEEDIKTYGIEYVVAGAHWPMYVPFEREALIRDYHRQNMFLATHPLVTIVAHPWWWYESWHDADGRNITLRWLDDFRAVPASMHDEFAAAAIQHHKVVEINLDAMLLNPRYTGSFMQQYLDFLACLHARGVSLSIGSDCHDAEYAANLHKAEEMLASAGIATDALWRLDPKV